MGTLYTLTPAETDTLSNLDQADVIATGPWAKGNGTLAHRSVIRRLSENELVTHTQIIGSERAFYEHGHYMHGDTEVERLRRALEMFNIKVASQHCIN